MSDTEFSRAPDTLPATFPAAMRAFVRHPSPVFLALLTSFFIGYRIHLGNWQPADIVAPVVILLWWPFQEWLIHVHLLHFKPRRVFGRVLDFPLPEKHRLHHREPWDITNIFIHKGVYFTVVPVLIFTVFTLMPSRELAAGALGMFFLLAFNYEFSHFIAHIRWCPPIAFYRNRVRAHRLHHFRNEALWWGVSMGTGDRVLGTAPPVSDSERSLTASNLHGLTSG